MQGLQVPTKFAVASLLWKHARSNWHLIDNVQNGLKLRSITFYYYDLPFEITLKHCSEAVCTLSLRGQGRDVSMLTVSGRPASRPGLAAVHATTMCRPLRCSVLARSAVRYARLQRRQSFSFWEILESSWDLHDKSEAIAKMLQDTSHCQTDERVMWMLCDCDEMIWKAHASLLPLTL